MCNEKKNCCCEKETSTNKCDKNKPHKENGTEKEFPCGEERKNKEETCCCEEK